MLGDSNLAISVLLSIYDTSRKAPGRSHLEKEMEAGPDGGEATGAHGQAAFGGLPRSA